MISSEVNFRTSGCFSVFGRITFFTHLVHCLHTLIFLCFFEIFCFSDSLLFGSHENLFVSPFSGHHETSFGELLTPFTRSHTARASSCKAIGIFKAIATGAKLFIRKKYTNMVLNTAKGIAIRPHMERTRGIIFDLKKAYNRALHQFPMLS